MTYGYGVNGDDFWEFMKLHQDEKLDDLAALRAAMFKQVQLTMSLLDQVRLLNEQMLQLNSQMKRR